MSENLAQQIDGKLSDYIYCVYTDYESDHTGEYTAVLGCKVPDANNIPCDFFTAHIPAGDYHVYKPQGKFPECVANTWREIWQAFINRKVDTADYDPVQSRFQSHLKQTEVEGLFGSLNQN